MTRARLLLVAVLAGGTALTGCTTLGGNIKGSFACTAPEGICAPSSTIDDRALAMISGEAGDTMIQPAGPVQAPRIEGRGFQTASLAPPGRTRERVLRIVFPAQIDGAGRLHEQTAVHAVVEQGDWQQALAAEAVATTSTQVAAATGGDTLLAAVERADPPIAETPEQDPDLPSAAAVAAARARGGVATGGDPIGDIKDQVARRLSPRARSAPARSTVGRAVPSSLAGQQLADATPVQPLAPVVAAPRANGATSPTRPPASAPSPRLAYPAVPVTPGIALPAKVTSAGRAAVTSVAANPTIRAGLSRAEPEAREQAKSAGVIPVVRASSFPGVEQ